MISNNNPNQLKFDTSSISQNGFNNPTNLGKGFVEQRQFVQNYNSYQPSSTFSSMDNTSRSAGQNFRDFAQYGVENAFHTNKVIEKMPDTKYLQNTLYDNLNENLNKETIQEFRLNIDSMDRDIELYPDPFEFTTVFGPIVNSGYDATIKKLDSKYSFKRDVRNINKKQNPNNPTRAVEEDINDDEIIFNTNPNILVDYVNKLKRIYNPYITRSFVNVKFIRLDGVHVFP